MYTIDEYHFLKSKYGSYSSWAIWDSQRESDTSIIDKNIDKLQADYIFLGLNISASLGVDSWVNFHGGKHDRKLKYACNDTKLRGSYLTDLLKGIPEARSNKLMSQLTEEVINENVKTFNEEMNDVRINESSQFIVLGTQDSQIAQIFNRYFKQEYKNPVIYHYHYSYYGITDEVWVQGLWKKLGIDANYKFILNKYK